MRFKIIFGLIKFYLVFSIFGMFANIITYVSADMLLVVQNKESYLYAFFTSPEALNEHYALETVSYFMKTAINSIPGDAYFEDTLGIFLDGANGNVFTFMENVLANEGVVKTLKLGFADYVPYFLRDMSVTMLASFVIFAVSDLKDKILDRKSLSIFLGFSFSLFFWLLAGYTFGNCLVTALEQRVAENNRIILYIILIIFSVGFETTVHSFAKKCPLSRLLILSSVKILFSVITAFLAWLMCASVTSYFSLQVIPSLFILSLLFLIFFAVESNTSRWAETGESFIKLK